MKIKIESKNTDKIRATLDEVQGNANARILFTGFVLDLAERGEDKLADLGIPKKYREGASMAYCEGGLPNPYKYKANTTLVQIERGKSAWYLVACSRVSIYPREKGRHDLTLTERQLDIIMSGYRDGVEL